MGITAGQVTGATGPLLSDHFGAALARLPAIGALGAAVVLLIVLIPRRSVGASWGLVVGLLAVAGLILLRHRDLALPA